MRILGALRFQATGCLAALGFVALLLPQCSALAITAPYGVDLDGHPVMLASSTAPAIVLFFTASDCSIANRYEPEMLRLEQELAPAAVEFCGCIRTLKIQRQSFVGTGHNSREARMSFGIRNSR